MKIALTGATGFIGIHVLKSLVDAGHKPVIISRKKQINNNLSQFKLVNLDLSQIENNIYEKIGKPDLLIHLAWGGLPNYNSKYHIHEELPIQINFLREMIQSGLKNLFVSGTCFEYGIQENALDVETKLNPINEYGTAKVNLYRELKLLHKKFDFNLVWARLFYIYGRGQSNNSLMGQLEKAVRNNEKCFNMSSGEQLRDYMKVEDVAENIVKISLLNRDLGAINLCSGKPIKVLDLVKKICTENNWKIKLNLGFYDISKNEPKNFWGIPSDKLLKQ